MLILALATAAYGYAVKFIVDQANALSANSEAIAAAKHYAYLILPILIGLPLASGLAGYMQRILANTIALTVVGDLQKDMFKSAHGADYSFFTAHPIGTLISKFTHDVSVLTNALIRALSNLIKDVLTLVFILSAMLMMDWQLSLLVLVVYPLAAWPIISITKRLRGNAHDVQAHIGHLTAELKDSFTHAKMIKTYNLEAHEQTRLSKSFNERIRLYVKLVSEQARVDPLLEVFGGLAIAGVVIFGVYQVTSGHATPGDIAGVLTLILMAAPRIRALGTLNTVVQEGLAAGARIFDVIDTQPTLTDAPDAKDIAPPTGHIKIENISFSYPDGTQALRDVSLTAKPGDTIALVGPSGGGKSTLFNALLRLFDVESGRILLDDMDIQSITLTSLRQHMAMVSQNVALFHDTVAANIGLGDLDASRDDIIAAAKAAEAHDFIMALDKGYDTVLGEDGHTLSGGQRQRLSIARALLRDAPILLLDEATSALDSETEAKIQSALERLTQDRTTLVIAHRLSTIQNADRIYVLDKGQVVESGTHKTLSRKRGGVYKRLKDLQS